ncbi:alpha/beta fold hydrolase [Alteribacter natronophilus]|uniref:alpha/beta fold hydrolase n=1 Tax=Alteribacter natronophilus TaxID=2583810 RepID=UPI00110D72DB|nr:alpha/beta hydrolase [Alteribacter natronophilus]TMW72129.1 alpha/beta hydrolase [Alteribacter natronophilus]
MPWTKERGLAGIYYEIKGSGPPLLFIHPPGMGHVTFRHQAEGLCRTHTVIQVDIRANGRSGMDDQPLSMALLADDVRRVLDAAGIRKTFLCGYSNGGSIVQEFAIRYPERTRGIVLLGGFSEVNSFLLRNEFRTGIIAARLRGMRTISEVLAAAHEKGARRKELADYVRRTSPAFLAELYDLGLHYKSTDRLHRITSPVLLVYGQCDYYVHHYRYIFQKHLRVSCDVIYVSMANHQLPTKHPKELNRILKEFTEKTRNREAHRQKRAVRQLGEDLPLI